MLAFCSHCSTNAKTQEGYCLLLGCFSRMNTLMFFRRRIQIHAVSHNCVTSKPPFSFRLVPPNTRFQPDCHLRVGEANASLPMCRCTNEINLTTNCRVLKSYSRSAATAVTLALATELPQSSAAGTCPLCGVSCSVPYDESRRKERAERL